MPINRCHDLEASKQTYDTLETQFKNTDESIHNLYGFQFLYSLLHPAIEKNHMHNVTVHFIATRKKNQNLTCISAQKILFYAYLCGAQTLSSLPVQGSVHQHYFPLPSPMFSKKVDQTSDNYNPLSPICVVCQIHTALDHQDGLQPLLLWQKGRYQELNQSISRPHQDLFQLHPLHPGSQLHLSR